MQRRILSPLSIIIFTFFTVLGYLTASGGFSHLFPRATGLTRPTAFAVQHNLLLIHVDRLNTHRPILRAAWIAGFFRSPNQTVLTFYPLLSERATQVAQENFKAMFSLNPDGSPGRAFFQAISTKGIKTYAYLVVDDQGFHVLDEYLRRQDALIMTSTLSDPQLLLNASCRFILTGTSPKITSHRFDWDTFSDHLSSDLAREDLIASWESLHDPLHPARCKILP
jgi:hypothetical protein